MARWRLHPTLGGAELDDGGDSTIGTVAFRFDGVDGLVHLPRKLLTGLGPTVPPEPPVGSVVHCDAGYVHMRRPASGWDGHDDEERSSWNRIHADCGGAVLLVRDPMTAAPQLPYRWASEAHAVSVAVVPSSGQIRVSVTDQTDEVTSAPLTPSVARAAGLALLRAASEQEAR